MRRPIGIAASSARGRFGDVVEGVKRDDWRKQGMSALMRHDGLPAGVRLTVDDEQHRAERGKTVEGVEKPLAGGVVRREGENWKPGFDDRGRAVQDFSGENASA